MCSLTYLPRKLFLLLHTCTWTIPNSRSETRVRLNPARILRFIASRWGRYRYFTISIPKSVRYLSKFDRRPLIQFIENWPNIKSFRLYTNGPNCNLFCRLQIYSMSSVLGIFRSWLFFSLSFFHSCFNINNNDNKNKKNCV